MEHAHTEDDKIKDLFEDYNPVMKSDLAFMTRLKHNMDSMELVKSHNRRAHRINIMAMTIAGVVGFLTGAVMTLLWITLAPSLPVYALNLNYAGISQWQIAMNHPVWAVMVAAVAFVSVSTYREIWNIGSLKSQSGQKAVDF